MQKPHSKQLDLGEKENVERQELLAQVLRSEVNLLVLPFFALSKKGLKGKSHTDYRATIYRDGKKFEILWEVTANARYGYPGPFDKRVHKAIEQIVDSLSLPIQNPIRIGSLYKIAKLMGLQPTSHRSYSGEAYRKIKSALERIVLTGVRSVGALYSKAKHTWLDDVFHLYDRVVFKGEQLEDGSIADTNYLYLGSWYLENLNARYVRPLDYTYYCRLKNPLTQRLYELLGVKFYYILQGGEPSIRYRYSTLCQLLPIARQRYPSEAKRVLEPAHRRLQRTGFLAKVEWGEAEAKPEEKDKLEDWYIYYYPGRRAVEEIQKYKPTAQVLEIVEPRQPRALRSAVKGEVEVLVQDILGVTGDEKSLGFYYKVARGVPADLIYRCLSEVKDEWQRGLIRTTKGAVFTDKIKRYCQQYGIELKLKS